MAIERKLMTAAELFMMPDDGMEHELIRGELRTMPPPGPRHEEIAAEILFRIGGHVRAHELGRVYGGPGFIVEHDPDTVRAPDFVFIAAGRLPEGPSPERYTDLIPDLIAEVVSPGDSAADVNEKMLLWLAAGVRVGLALYPRTRSVYVYRSPSDARLLGPDDVLDVADVIPGFSCRVSDFFPL